MAKTLLDGVNELLKRVGEIRGDTGVLASLVDSGRQNSIDIAVQIWNESVDELYSTTALAMPNELAENTITLVLDDRDYVLQSDLLELRFPLQDETNGHFISEYPGGYQALVESQPQPANFKGLPQFAAIRPTDGLLYLDTLPQTAEAGRIYKYRYDKETVLTLATDVFPFTDAVFRALVPAGSEVWERKKKRQFDQPMFDLSMGRAGRLLNQTQPRQSWKP